MPADRKKRHHTVPKFYLKGWAYDDQVHPIDKATQQVKTLSVADACVVKDFHTVPEGAGLANSAFMEDDLSRFESSVAPVIKALPEAGWPLKPNRRAATADFIAMLLVRSQRMRRIIAERGSPVSWSANTEDNPVSMNLRYLVRGQQADGAAPAHTHVTQMPHMFAAFRPQIARARWLRIGFTDPILVTGDSPVAFVTSITRVAWLADQTFDAFVVPLSPVSAMVLCLSDGDASNREDEDWHIAGSEEDAALINGWTMALAERWVYKHPYSAVTIQSVAGEQMKASRSFQAQGNEVSESVVRWGRQTDISPSSALVEYYGTAINYGNERKREGDIEGAREAFVTAANSDDADVAAAAHLSLAMLEHELGDVQAAQANYAEALTGPEEIHGLVYFQLGLLHRERGDTVKARQAYRRAIDREDPRVSPVAAFNLGHLELELGSTNSAVRAFRFAAAATAPEVADLALAAQAQLDSLEPDPL